MSEEKTRPWVIVLLVIVLALFIVTGGYALSKDHNSIAGFLLLGLGLGGVVAGWGTYVANRDEKR